jgi:TonB family protein
MLRTIRSNAEDPIKKDVLKEANTRVEFARADRRDRRRSPIAVPMLARWTDDREHEVKVNSRDISDGGIFFHANCDIAIGTEVEVTFTLPSDPGAAGNRRLRVQGTVIRAEHEADKTGYAVGVSSSEVLEADDTIAQARQAVRRLAANDGSSSGPFRARRARVLLLACGGLLGLVALAALVIFVIRRQGGPGKAVAAIREMVASIRPTTQNAPPQRDVPESKVERKRKVLRTAGVVGAKERKAAPSTAERGAGELNVDASPVQDRSPAESPTVQPGPVFFENNHVVMLDVQKGKPVSQLGYIGELPSPPAQPVPADSLANTPTKTDAAAATPSSTAVVLRVVVGRDGRVEDVQRASGPVELSPASVAAIRHWKFPPDPGGAIHRQIYVTVNFTISPE